METGFLPLPALKWTAREGSGRMEMVEGFRVVRGRKECVCFNLLKRENFFSLQGGFSGLSRFVLGFSTAI